MLARVCMHYRGSRVQGNSDGCEAEVDETAACAPPPQDDQQGARPQGCLRLCHDLTQVTDFYTIKNRSRIGKLLY
jgi:hypothetical protein